MRFIRSTSLRPCSRPDPPGAISTWRDLPRAVDAQRLGKLVQPALEHVDALADKLVGRFRREALRDHGPSRGRCGIDCGFAHLTQGFRLGAGDLVLGELHAPLEAYLHRTPRLGGEDLGLFGGEADDRLRLLGDIALLASVIIEHLLGLFAQALRLVEFLGDGGGSRVECGGDLLVHAEIEHGSDEEEERYRDPEFGLEQEFHRHSFRAAPTACSISALAGATPMRRRTMSVATSAATALTSFIAEALALSMRASAPAPFLARSFSSRARSAAVSALSLTRPSSTMA